MKYLDNEIIDVKYKIDAKILDNVDEYKKDLKRLQDIERVLNTSKVQAVIQYLIDVEEIDDIRG